MTQDDKPKSIPAGEQRKAKLALALKANLKRRKAQSREIAALAKNADKPNS